MSITEPPCVNICKTHNVFLLSLYASNRVLEKHILCNIYYIMLKEILRVNIKDIINYDWFKRFFGRGRNSAKSKSIESNSFSGFDAIDEEIGRRFGQLSPIRSNAPNELVREYLSS